MWILALIVIRTLVSDLACTADTTVCTDHGHDCCANVFAGEPATCVAGFVPSHQPTDYQSGSQDCRDTGAPNFGCCPGGAGESGAALRTGSAAGNQHACPFGWTFADGACFKLFGANASEHKTWPQAEAACREHGAYLATLDSQSQIAATEVLVTGLVPPPEVAARDSVGPICSREACRDSGNNDCNANVNNGEPALCAPGFAPTHQPTQSGANNYECCKKGLEVAWIGLTDQIEEGAWVWSEGEPLGEKLAGWAVGEPTSTDTECGEEDCAAITTMTTGGRGSGWADVGCSSFRVGEGRCVASRLAYICRKDTAPRASLIFWSNYCN